MLLDNLNKVLEIADRTHRLCLITRYAAEKGLIELDAAEAIPNLTREIVQFSEPVRYLVYELDAVRILLASNVSISKLNLITLCKNHAAKRVNDIKFNEIETHIETYKNLIAKWGKYFPNEYEAFKKLQDDFRSLKEYPYRKVFTQIMNLVEDDSEDWKKMYSLLGRHGKDYS